MRNQRLALGLILVLAGVSLEAQTKEQALSVTGKLTRAMAIGGESTGWMIQLDAETNIEGKQVSSIEVSYRKVSSL